MSDPKPPALDPASLAAHKGSSYPEPFRVKTAERSEYVDNLIIEVFGRRPPPERKGRRKKNEEPGRRWSVGVLPAVPYLVRR